MEIKFSVTDVVYLVYNMGFEQPVSRLTQSYIDDGIITPKLINCLTIIGPCVITGITISENNKSVYRLDCGINAYTEELHTNMLGAFLAYAKLIDAGVTSRENFPIESVEKSKLDAVRTRNEIEEVIDKLCPIKL